jgi:hypothetical protein
MPAVFGALIVGGAEAGGVEGAAALAWIPATA